MFYSSLSKSLEIRIFPILAWAFQKSGVERICEGDIQRNLVKGGTKREVDIPEEERLENGCHLGETNPVNYGLECLDQLSGFCLFLFIEQATISSSDTVV